MHEPDPDNAVLAALERFTIGDLLVNIKPGVISIDAGRPLKAGLRLMNSQGFMSLPVTNEKKQVIGNIDLLDVITFYSKIYSRVLPLSKPPISFRYDRRMGSDLKALANESYPDQEIPSNRFGGCEEQNRFNGTSLSVIVEADWMCVPISLVMNASKRNAPSFVVKETSLSDFTRALTTGWRHRSLVVDNDHIREITPQLQNVLAIISQHDIAVFIRRLFYWATDSSIPGVVTEFYEELFQNRIYDLKEHIAKAAFSRIKDLGLGTTQFVKSIVSVEAGVPVIDALKFIVTCKVSILAVINKSGKFLDSLSGTDLRRLRPEDWNSLALPVSEFLEQSNTEKLPPVKIGRRCCLLDTLDEFAALRSSRPIHHIWLCDEQERAIGLMSLTDLMRIATTYHLPRGRKGKSIRTIGQLCISILLARNLKPSKNETRKGRSAYVAVKYPSQRAVKTPVCPGSLSPSFKSATFSFTVNTSHIGKDIVISLFDKRSFFTPDKLLGQISVGIAWIANGFGKGTMTDTMHETMKWIALHLPNVPDNEKLGELLVKISYSPRLE